MQDADTTKDNKQTNNQAKPKGNFAWQNNYFSSCRLLLRKKTVPFSKCHGYERKMLRIEGVNSFSKTLCLN